MSMEKGIVPNYLIDFHVYFPLCVPGWVHNKSRIYGYVIGAQHIVLAAVSLLFSFSLSVLYEIAECRSFQCHIVTLNSTCYSFRNSTTWMSSVGTLVHYSLMFTNLWRSCRSLLTKTSFPSDTTVSYTHKWKIFFPQLCRLSQEEMSWWFLIYLLKKMQVQS